MTICSIFLDIAKAFDSVNHNIMLMKLEQYGVKGVANELIRSYLTNRKQIVLGSNQSSSLLNINVGVPQGSVLGPLLFLIYITDLALCSRFNVTMYADDSVLTIANKNYCELQSNITTELNKIDMWFNNNQLSINSSKTKFMIFASKKRHKNLNVVLNQQTLEQVKTIKYLGVYLDDKLDWSKHINYLESKLAAAAGILCQLRKYTPPKILLAVYHSVAYTLEIDRYHFYKPIPIFQKCACRYTDILTDIFFLH